MDEQQYTAGTYSHCSPEPHQAYHRNGTADAHAVQALALEALRAEVEQLRHALEGRPGIELAQGMVMAMVPCSAETAWWTLVRVSQRTNVKLRVVAEQIVASVDGSRPQADVGKALKRAIAEVRAGTLRSRSTQHPGRGGDVTARDPGTDEDGTGP
ncbi:ANTAR domain-containing protein [Streptomyces sp. NPDC001941]|uniref:ANTAR domain-containing protein n=1 Tax=Streptomyces sp. NPDC001941 TaxID=3154659 RepID=UPI00331DB77A